jgi:hypothetical protein
MKSFYVITENLAKYIKIRHSAKTGLNCTLTAGDMEICCYNSDNNKDVNTLAAEDNTTTNKTF